MADRYRYEATGERALIISLLFWVLSYQHGMDGLLAVASCVWMLIAVAYGILYFMAPKP